jgi:endonuclease/exonuclease/phosphatase family metal-dependent hydrolase
MHIKKILKTLLFIPLVMICINISKLSSRRVKRTGSIITHVKGEMKKMSSNLLSFMNTVQKDKTDKEKAALLESEDTFRIMSFNIRLKDKKDEKKNSWAARKESVASMIRFHHMDIIGIQEPLKQQLKDLNKILPEYEYFGLGLENGKDKGITNAIFYRKSRFEVMDENIFYLSPTPDKPSKGWDAMFHRGVSWVKLRDKKTLKIFFFFNTHFDYHSQWARDESAYLIREKIDEIVGKNPFILTGDFNLFPELDGEETYNILIGKDKKDGKILHDAQYKAAFPHHGPTGTWSGFKEAGQPGIKPDYIFVDDFVKVVSHGVLADNFDGKFPSDHLPVISEIKL